MLVPCRYLIPGMNPFIPRSMRARLPPATRLKDKPLWLGNELRSMLSVGTLSPSLSEQVP